ncbi:MAG: cobalamin-dependent protein [Proteobacteria bacterium]|nr:cobalamin-dependent protein [Pseudomonadota bacterium]
MNKKKLIYLADLTHRGLVLSSNVFPLSIGLIAAYLIEKRPEDFEIELFKYPEDFSAAFERRKPDIVAFANYSWNFHISYEFTRIIKNLWPDMPVVFGGPNYGLESDEVSEFWKKYDLIDFYVVREGEEAFVRLMDALLANEMSIAAIKSCRAELPNCHYAKGDEIVIGPDLPRLTLEEIPSPYLMGLMDKFFDESLGPMIHTTRGCPFRCAFCTEGSPYYNIVEQRMGALRDELHYIAQRVRGPLDLYISDANFGMFRQDMEKAEMLADCQKQYGYPRYIHVSTGKNQKERVIEIAKLLDGALSMAASLQSTDPVVLSNVSRSNISVSKLTAVGKLANKVDAGTYSEIILGLPGDSFDAHRQSLRDCVNANFDNIRMYQLIMLPQTELNTPASRRKFGMKSKHRVMPRSFGRYHLAGHDFVAVESEEILVENSTLSFEDYIRCRELDLTVELLHNGKVYEELQSYCEIAGVSWFDFILRFYENRRGYGADISAMYDDFREGLTSRLWQTREELTSATTSNIDEMLRNERGTNEMSMGKATGFFILFEQINDILFDEMKSWLVELGLLNSEGEAYLDEVRRFSRLRKMDLMDCDTQFVENFTFDVEALAASHFTVTPTQVRLPEPRRYKIAHLPEQSKQITAYVKEFGRLHDGMGKMLMRYPHIHRLFRRPQPA